ncbi:MAG: aspartate aminotransferase family protein [Halieaceae bacterium]|jgi:acetylornithine aminotransferase|nr:aspartate aminotransferase family protein [Halieaceae bacterium]
MASALMNTYKRLDVTFTHGEGAWLVDSEGRRYLDAIAGIGVNSLGHAHPAVTAAVSTQAGKLVHTSNLYRVEHQETLAQRLAEVSGLSRCFIGNSGAEANEAAIKLARLYGHQREIQNPAVIVMEHAFHGRTMAALSASGNRKIQAGFEPLVSGFTRAPFGDAQAVRTIAENNHSISAVLVEPIQGEGGINLPPAGYLAELREICDQHHWLLMFDEVQCGNCRTGTWYACQGESVVPDIITTAKALANGVPIGACMAGGAAAEVFQAGHHGSTYGGNPLACAAALAVIETMEAEGIADHAAATGAQILAGFRERLGDLPGVRDIRGRGMMLGIELDEPCGELVTEALAAGLLINVTAGNVIRLLPPLILNQAEAEQLVDGVSALVTRFLQQDAPARASA